MSKLTIKEIFDFISASEKMGAFPVVMVKSHESDDFDEILIVSNKNCLGCVDFCFIEQGDFTQSQYTFEKINGDWTSCDFKLDSDRREFYLYQFSPLFHVKELDDKIKNRMGIAKNGEGFLMYRD